MISRVGINKGYNKYLNLLDLMEAGVISQLRSDNSEVYESED